jgi:hypothetical protein
MDYRNRYKQAKRNYKKPLSTTSYPFNGIIAQSNMHEMSVFGTLKMIGKKSFRNRECRYIRQVHTTNRFGLHIVNFLRKENIDIFKIYLQMILRGY